MARVKCDVYHETQENDYGTESPCVRAECSKCGHETMCWGDSDSSVRRCLALMNEECPRVEDNFYVES